MTARSKVTLVEAQQIRSRLILIAQGKPDTSYDWAYRSAVDRLLKAGVIDTDAALNLLLPEPSTEPAEED